jgi:hypothetical protein
MLEKLANIFRVPDLRKRVLFTMGLLAVYRREVPVFAYTCLTLLLYVFWPTRDVRFVFPLLPFLAYFTVAGMTASRFLSDGRHPKAGVMLGCACWVLVAALFVRSLLFLPASAVLGRVDESGPFDPLSQEMFRFVSEHTEPRSVVVFFKPRVMRLLTDRDAIMIADPKELRRGDYDVYAYGEGPDYQVPVEAGAQYEAV